LTKYFWKIEAEICWNFDWPRQFWAASLLPVGGPAGGEILKNGPPLIMLNWLQFFPTCQFAD
jgi:hypothetical protein